MRPAVLGSTYTDDSHNDDSHTFGGDAAEDDD